MTHALLLLFAVIPFSPIAEHRCDLAEHHTLMSDDGREVFSQFVFWDWNARHGRHEVVEFIVDKEQVLKDGNLLLFSHMGNLHAVRAEHWRETVSQKDEELAERQWRPLCKRRKFWGGM